MKTQQWIGRFIIFIGIIHIFVGLIFIGHVGLEILQEGLFNTVHGQPMREAFFWFTFGGLTLMIIGQLANWYESQQIVIPSFLGWNLLGLALLVVFIMPASGGWLLLLPAVAILSRKSTRSQRSDAG